MKLCQDLSTAGLRKGLKPGTRSGLWSHYAYAIKQLNPKVVVIENVAGLLNADALCEVEPCTWCVGDEPVGHMRALGAVLSDLASLGFDAQWGSFRASSVGAPHRRERIFIIARPQVVGDSVGDREFGRSTTEGGNGRVPGFGRSGGVLGTEFIEGSVRGFSGPDNVGLLVESDLMLPTPVVNDMGRGKTIEWWDDWNTRVNHGKSLDIEAVKLAMLPTPTVQAGTHGGGTQDRGPGSPDDSNLWIVGKRSPGTLGEYGPVLHRWASIIGRDVPAMTVVNKRGQHELSPVFVEFMMGLPEGWVTGADISPQMQLKALGNGVVPGQAYLALTVLDPRVGVKQEAEMRDES